MMEQDINIISDTILDYIPQQDPFRFIDRIIEVDENFICGQYRFKKDEFFYKGHFPGNPVTPGVILTETMAQIGICSLSIFLMLQDNKSLSTGLSTLFTEAETEFLNIVRPEDLVTVKAKKIYWRRNKLKAECEMTLEDGTVAARGILAGMGVTNG